MHIKTNSPVNRDHDILKFAVIKQRLCVHGSVGHRRAVWVRQLETFGADITSVSDWTTFRTVERIQVVSYRASMNEHRARAASSRTYDARLAELFDGARSTVCNSTYCPSSCL